MFVPAEWVGSMENVEIRHYWERIINTMNDGLMLVSPQGAIMMVNRSFERLTGYTAREVIGKSCTILECDACERALNNSSHKWCKLFQPGQKEIRLCRCAIVKKDGSYLPAYKNASVLRDENGTVIGAVETLTDISEIDRLDRKVALLSEQLNDQRHYHGMIGSSPVMQKVFHVIEKASRSDAPIIIYGESGTGKELVAQAIHEIGRRKNGPYVKLNCGALNPALLESELFGHIKGAFTGAYRHREGRFEAADGGDIFLDEIGDMPSSLQVKLLRVLENKQFERVGDHHTISVDVRIISATNQNLMERVSQKQFREDLFFRINVIPIHLPPLRQRREDIPILATHFIGLLNASSGKAVSGLTKEALSHLLGYAWPGNIRELKSALEYAFAIMEKGAITPDHLPPQVIGQSAAGPFAQLPEQAVVSDEKDELIAALKKTGGNQTQAARLLGINRVTVWNRMKKYGIDLKRVLTT